MILSRLFLTGLRHGKSGFWVRGRWLCGYALANLLVCPCRADDVLIRGGTVVDGTGTKPRRADVRIAGDTIRKVGRLTPKPGERVINASGLIIAPGFIDAHSHADGGLLENPLTETVIRQGITTVVVGQDGGSNFPLRDWFAKVEATKVAPNVASFVGHGTLRKQVMGEDFKRHATAAETEKMRALARQEMKAGALGLSSGLEYDPGYYAATQELTALSHEAAAGRGLYISHVRDEGNNALQSFDELVGIARHAGLPAQISHIKLGTASVWGKSGEVLHRLEAARRAGLDVTADVYPYLFWQSTITVLTLSREWERRDVWETALAEVGGPGNVRLTTYSPTPAWEGKTLAELATQTGRDVIGLIQEIVRKTHSANTNAENHESVVVTAMRDDDLTAFLRDPHVMVCSDGGLKPTHPRGAGAFPRVLARYVREKHALTLQEAIRKMTSLPAKRFGFRDRGVIAPGKKADLVLFDAAKVEDRATVTAPAAPPTGIPIVFVNGVPVLENGNPTGARPGRTLPRPR